VTSRITSKMCTRNTTAGVPAVFCLHSIRECHQILTQTKVTTNN